MRQIEINEIDALELCKASNFTIYVQDLTGEYDYKLINTESILNLPVEEVRATLNSYIEQNNCSLVEAASSLYIDEDFKGLVKKQFIELFRTNRCNFVVRINALDSKNRKKWLKATFVIKTEGDIATKLLAIFEDITDSRYEILSLEEATRRDLFTGLLNKTNAFKLINKKIESSPKGKKCAFAILDLDSFKHFNDYYGHDVGDLVLETVAKCLNTHIASTDIVGRFGGDEFILYIDDYETEESLKEYLKRFLSYKVGSHIVKASIGVSLLNKDATTFNRLFKHADEALYVAKKNQDKIAFYNSKKE
ncbi:MAG: GGDEF domain-containing protein [Bacilli bacterium]|nr:GGDEF domain-containing protein [Bacilli bacterium]